MRQSVLENTPEALPFRQFEVREAALGDHGRPRDSDCHISYAPGIRCSLFQTFASTSLVFRDLKSTSSFGPRAVA